MSMHFNDYCDDTPHSKMNDLTKDELKFISDYIYLGVRDKKNHELLMRLDGKLQSLIDNHPSTDSCSEAIRKYHELED